MMNVYQISLEGTTIPYRLLTPRPNQRRVIFRMEDGMLTIRAPKWLKKSQLQTVIVQNQDWILTQYAAGPLIMERPLDIGDTILVCGNERRLVRGNYYQTGHRNHTEGNGAQEFLIPEHALTDVHSFVYAWLRTQANDVLRQMAKTLATRHSYFPNRITIKEQSRRWGSCSTLGNINLNWRLIQAPVHVQEYVIVHELAHLSEMNHSAQFWGVVKSMMPTYEMSKRWLKLHGQKLHALQPDFIRQGVDFSGMGLSDNP